jgi:LCP family protein required for cell wall assembly
MPASPGGALTVLVLGTDARPGEQFIARTDAIMVVRLDPAHHSVKLLSLPRDLWVPIPGAGEGRINTAFEIGEQIGEGAAEASATVGQVLGITIDHVLVMNFEGFRHLVDALGGIPVNVPSELYDPTFPTDDYGYTVAHFMPGLQIMSGDRALMYSRVRHPDSDFERMRRQQLVVVGIAQRLHERGVLRNLHEADQLTAALQPYIRTDMSLDLILRLIWDLRSVDPEAIQRLSADGTLLSEAYVGGAAVLIGDQATLHGLGAQLLALP